MLKAVREWAGRPSWSGLQVRQRRRAAGTAARGAGMRVSQIACVALLLSGALASGQAWASERTGIAAAGPLAGVAMSAPVGEASAPARNSSGGSRMGAEPEAPDTAAEPDQQGRAAPATPAPVSASTLPAQRGTDVVEDDDEAPRRQRPTGWRGTLPSGVH
jgi:hypothetical protein